MCVYVVEFTCYRYKVQSSREKGQMSRRVSLDKLRLVEVLVQNYLLRLVLLRLRLRPPLEELDQLSFGLLRDALDAFGLALFLELLNRHVVVRRCR